MSKQGEHGISWTDETWNPVRGCQKVSEGCRNCWASRMATRHEAMPTLPHLHGFAKAGKWTGKVALIESELERPLHMRRPRRIAVGLMGDLFRLPDADIDRVFAVMALCPQHTFQVLTKQAERMCEWAASKRGHFTCEWKPGYSASAIMPFENVEFGVSAEDQATLDERVPWLLKTPAARRWVSLEPLLGSVDVARYLPCPHGGPASCGNRSQTCSQCDNRRDSNVGLDHLVVGGESGPGARPCHPDWVRGVRDACVAAGVAFTFKQWGEWAPACAFNPEVGRKYECTPDSRMWRVGKRAAGSLLDGREHNG